MKLDLELYHDNSFMCYERGIATVALWLKRDFELMFMDVWGFSILCDDKAEKSVGQLVYPGEWNLEKYLRQYHGIQVTQKGFSSEQNLFSIINEQLNRNIPVMVDEDWLVTGIDKETEMVFLYIIHSSLYAGISYEEFGRGVTGRGINEYVIFEVAGEEDTYVQPDYLVTHTKERLGTVASQKTVYDQVKEFAEIFCVAFDFSLELEGAEDVYETPIVKNILDVSRGRKLFRLTVEYISRMAGTDQFKEVIQKLEIAENKWLFIMSLFIKAYHASRFSDAARMKLYQNIKDVVADEKFLCDFFIG